MCGEADETRKMEELLENMPWQAPRAGVSAAYACPSVAILSQLVVDRSASSSSYSGRTGSAGSQLLIVGPTAMVLEVGGLGFEQSWCEETG